MTLRLRIPRAALCAGLAAGLAACSSSSHDTTVTDPGGGTPTIPLDGYTHVRIVQVVSDATKGVDVSANNTPALGALPFGNFFPYTQGEYQRVSPAPQLAFTVTGATTPFYNQVPSALAANAYATAIAFGQAGSSGATAATVVALSDTNANSASGMLVRVFNAVDYVTRGTGTPVDVYVYAQGTARPTAPDVTALAYGARSAYLAKAAGTYQVDVFPARTASTGTPLFTGTVFGNARSVRTLVLYDPPAASTTATGGVLALLDVN